MSPIQISACLAFEFTQSCLPSMIKATNGDIAITFCQDTHLPVFSSSRKHINYNDADMPFIGETRLFVRIEMPSSLDVLRSSENLNPQALINDFARHTAQQCFEQIIPQVSHCDFSPKQLSQLKALHAKNASLMKNFALQLSQSGDNHVQH